MLASGRDRALEIIESFERDLNPDGIAAAMHNDLLALFDQYLKVGGLPAVVTVYFKGQSYQRGGRGGFYLAPGGPACPNRVQGIFKGIKQKLRLASSVYKAYRGVSRDISISRSI